MTVAERWVRENSKAAGSAWSLMLALSARAQGCVVVASAEQMITDARISRRELYRALLAQEELGEIERLSKVGSNKQLRAFHFPKFSCANTLAGSHPLCPRKQSPVPDLRIGNGSCANGMLPFPMQDFSPEECEECRGTGYKRTPRPDGIPGEVAVRCNHELAAVVGGRWKKLDLQNDPTWRPRFAQENGTPAAQQESFDWSRAELDVQKTRFERRCRELGISVREDEQQKAERLKNVVEFPVRKCSGF